MALTPEWDHRIRRWEEALWASCYRPLGTVNLSGFATTLKLSYEQALAGSFEEMPEGTPWGAKWEYGWFKGSLELPPQAEGRRIVVCLKPGGESLVWINGKVMGSIGWAHNEITLSRSAKTGSRYDILIEAYAGHGRITVGDGPNRWGYQTVPEPQAAQTMVGESSYGIWVEEAYQAAVDFSTLYELRGQLDPLSLRVSKIDEALMQVTQVIDFELPEAEMLVTLAAGRKVMQPLLEAKNGSTMPTLFGFGHAHIDVAWLWPLQETERKIARTAINQLVLFEEYPEYRFLQSQPHLYRMLKKDYPELYERFTDAIRTGNLIADGSMWVEADTNVSGGESLIRQVLYGRKFFREELGSDSRVLWLPDVFGYSGALPQILRGCGMIGFSTQKITWAYGGGEPFPYNTFWWEGIDGTAIPAHIFTDYNSQTRPKNAFERWNTRLQKNGIDAMVFAFGWGDGGGGPERNHIEFLRRGQDLEGMPRMKIASPQEFFEDLAAKGLPNERYVGELYFQAHRGTYTSQAKTKKGNRKSEFALREAEMWSTLAAVVKEFTHGPQILYEAWIKVLLNQFHDILPGSSIQRVYQEAEAAFQEVLAEAGAVTRTAQASFITAGPGLTVFNSFNWHRKALVETGTGLAEVIVPACGWTTVKGPTQVNPEEASAGAGLLPQGGAYLENELLRAEFNALGEIVSLRDKVTGREQMAAAGNSFRLYKDVPDIWDAWDLNSMTECDPLKLIELASLSVVRSGPLQASLRVSRRIARSDMTQTISLARGSRRIDFATGIDWQESHKLLKVNFPVNIHANEAVHEIQFGHTRRPNHGSRKYDADRFEVCNHKWSALVEEGRGVAVMNDCKYGLSVKGNSINLTLLKSALAPDMYADKGIQTFTYALYFWNGSLAQSGVVQEAYDLNAPVSVVSGTAGEGSLLNVSVDNVIVETVKMAEDGTGDVIVRMYEAMRTAVKANLSCGFSVTSACETNLVEEKIKDLALSGSNIELEFRPFEIKTVRLAVK
jgi:alpha-mannosidase